MKNSFNKETVVSSLVNTTSSVLGYIHAASTIVADLSIQGEARLKVKYSNQTEKEVTEARVLATALRQHKLGLRSALSILSDEMESIAE